MPVRIAINGFGRIGRNVLRSALLGGRTDFELVAINDLTDAATLAHLFEFDSVHGRFSDTVTVDGSAIVVGQERFEVLSERDPANLPWGDLGIDIVIESTGIFRKRQDAAKHIEAGAKKVLISAPAPDPDLSLVMGVNDGDYDSSKHDIISNASCTTNCIAPVVKVLLEEFGFERGLMTTVHSYTNDQSILDLLTRTCDVPGRRPFPLFPQRLVRRKLPDSCCPRCRVSSTEWLCACPLPMFRS